MIAQTYFHFLFLFLHQNVPRGHMYGEFFLSTKNSLMEKPTFFGDRVGCMGFIK